MMLFLIFEPAVPGASLIPAANWLSLVVFSTTNPSIVTPLTVTLNEVDRVEAVTAPFKIASAPRVSAPCRPKLGPRNVTALLTVTNSRSEEHTSELQSQSNLVCRLLLEKKKGRH